MTFRWRKLGMVLQCVDFFQTPTPLILEDRIRIYGAKRDAAGRSYVAYVDVDIDSPTNVIDPYGPVQVALSKGRPGAFDCDGVLPSYAEMLHDGAIDLWYSGWCNLGGDARYHNATGMVRSFDGGKTFQRIQDGPVLDRTPKEPYLAVTPSLCHGTMMYISGLRWELIKSRGKDTWEPIYVIRQAQRIDGKWERELTPVIPQAHELECFSRPWIKQIGHIYHLWFCARSAEDYRDGHGAYRLGYARSDDGMTWKRRDDEIGYARATDGWEGTMQCYPAVVEAKGKLFMFTNGNGFGKFGFGVAVAE